MASQNPCETKRVIDNNALENSLNRCNFDCEKIKIKD